MISIIIPIYNRGKQIGKCLESIWSQFYSNYEVIIINDGSTDQTLDVLEKYKPKFGLKLIIRTQKRQGPQNARNYGAKLAKGEYLLFCDADAILEPTMLRAMLDALKAHPEASYAYSSFIWVKKLFRLEAFSAKKLKTMPYIHTTSLIRREHFPGFNPEITRLQDWDLWLTMLENGHSGIFVDQVLFRKQSAGTMSSWLPKFAYKIFPFLPSVRRYKKAVAIIKAKHNLP